VNSSRGWNGAIIGKRKKKKQGKGLPVQLAVEMEGAIPYVE
jgi:predicted transcriptional regulator